VVILKPQQFHTPRAGRGIGPGRAWHYDALVLACLGVTVTLLFAVTPLDIEAARIFYSTDVSDQWPLAAKLPWSVLYRLAPWITASLVLIGLAGLIAGLACRRVAWRWQAVFVLLSVLLGPGLIINGIFKDHWERPRPRDIVEFGGPMPYVIAPMRGQGGASFPCGHCSVGFLYGLGWWIWRGRRPYWARASLAAGLLAGAALGLGRMAAGGHFLSDVVWSALLALGLAHALYYYVLRIPFREAHEANVAAHVPSPGLQGVLSILAAFGGVAVLLALFATPHGAQLAAEIPLSSFGPTPRVLDVRAKAANVEIIVIDTPATRLSISGELHGFGLPTSRLLSRVRFNAGPIPTLHYRIEQRGWFTDLDGLASLRVPAGTFEQIVVRIEHGNIRVTDATRDGVVRGGQLHLDLQTGKGHVQAPRH
jgi:lipid A 4'-phosphatase